MLGAPDGTFLASTYGIQYKKPSAHGLGQVALLQRSCFAVHVPPSRPGPGGCRKLHFGYFRVGRGRMRLRHALLGIFFGVRLKPFQMRESAPHAQRAEGMSQPQCSLLEKLPSIFSLADAIPRGFAEVFEGRTRSHDPGEAT